MVTKKQWIQAATVGVDEESGALSVKAPAAEASLAVLAGLVGVQPLADQFEGRATLPNNTTGTLDFSAKPVRCIDVWVEAGGHLHFSLKGTATSSSPKIDESMVLRIRSAVPISTFYYRTTSNVSAIYFNYRAW